MSEADKCKSLYAWVDKQPGPQKSPTLYVTGIVNAPTPCHKPHAVYIGDKKSNPPIYLLKLAFMVRPDICPQVETERELRYVQPNYVGNHGSLELTFTDGSVKSVGIKIIS